MGLPASPSNTAIQPIIVGAIEQTMFLSETLNQSGILVSAIRPPTVPEGTARLRITLGADHSHKQIEQLVEAVGNSMRSTQA